jgi:hypothetical protein
MLTAEVELSMHDYATRVWQVIISPLKQDASAYWQGNRENTSSYLGPFIQYHVSLTSRGKCEAFVVER